MSDIGQIEEQVDVRERQRASHHVHFVFKETEVNVLHGPSKEFHQKLSRAGLERHHRSCSRLRVVAAKSLQLINPIVDGGVLEVIHPGTYL